MSIKADRWIKQMSLEQKMIEPFEEKQVRKGVISYGLSSYGYDLRIADEFKIFTNVFGAVVDPKNFDPKSFVDFKGEVCIIPPNSFILGKTVEYVRIPSNVMTICIGKSTYARCFSGDTKIALADGTSVSFVDMIERYEKGELFWGYSVDDRRYIHISLLEKPRRIGKEFVLKVSLDNGEHILCTPDHEFIRKDGVRTKACDLESGDSLMPLYRRLHRGYESVYQPCLGRLIPTHRMSDAWNLRNGIYCDMPNTHRHHFDGNKLNNRPDNIKRIQAKEHIGYHNAIYYGENFDAEYHSKVIKAALNELRKDDIKYRNFVAQQKVKSTAFWRDTKYEIARKELLVKFSNRWTPEARNSQRDKQTKFWHNNNVAKIKVSEKSKSYWSSASSERKQQQAAICRQIKLRQDITEDSVNSALLTAGSIRGAAKLLNCDRSVFRRFEHQLNSFKSRLDANHKVVSIEYVKGEQDVFCLTAPEFGNFALSSGVFVSNCGLIANLTPLEPGWKGYVTLEISNTTPLPAKIYANEGIVQVLFFESDEQCLISYADKKGKYQAQQGVTLPRI